MRKVTCRITGESGYSHEFYKAPNGKYYKNKELYESTMEQREYRTKLYRITHLLKELARDGIIPVDYDYSKIREVLIENNLITIDSIRQTVATEYALENGFYFIASVSTKKEEPTYGYYVSEKLKNLLIEIFSQYENIDELKRVS